MALIKCKECGKEISDQATSCPNCGCPITTNNVINTPKSKINGLAITSLVCSLLLPFLMFVPILGLILGLILALLSFIFGIIGICNSKKYGSKGIAISGLVISIVFFVIICISIFLSIGIQLFSTSLKPFEDSDINTIDVLTYNSEFTIYEGQQNGVRVMSLCEKIMNHNEKNLINPSKQIIVQQGSAKNITSSPTTAVTKETVNNIKNLIKAGSKYIIDFGYNNNGYIVAVGIAKE